MTLEPDTDSEEPMRFAWDAAPSTVSEIEDLIACVMSAEAGLIAKNVRHDTKKTSHFGLWT